MLHALKEIMKYSPILAASLLSSLSTFAYAQDPIPAALPAPAAAAPLPVPSSPPLASTGAPLGGSFCGVGDVSGVDAGEASVAARVVCDEVWRAAKGQPSATYRVSLGKLGAKILVRLESTEASGSRDERHLELVSVDEISLAAPRLAEALIEKKTMLATESARNVLATSTKIDNQKRGSMKFEAGIVGTAVLGPSLVSPAPGLYMQLAYATERASLNTGLRFGVGNRTQNFGLNAGADYHLSDADIAPFVGGGAAWTVMGVQPDGDPKLSASGFGVYAQAGVTAFRTSRTNFRVGLRADIPFYSLEGTKYGVPGLTQAGSAASKPEHISVYSIPVSLTVGVALF
jgi:hypothetical protein